MTFYEWWDSKDTVVPSNPRELAKMAWDAALASRGDVQGGWINVNDSLPDDWVPVLVYVPERRLGVKDKGQCYAVAHRYGGSETYGPPGWTVASNLWGVLTNGAPTHWMPFPNPPSNSPRKE